VKLRALRDHKPVEITAVLGARPNAEIQDWNSLINQGWNPGVSRREQVQKRHDELVARYREYQAESKKRALNAEEKEAISELTIEIRQVQDILRTLPPENSASPRLAATSKYPGPTLTGWSDVSFPAGFTARELTKQLADNLHARGGVFITAVISGSPAEKAGLKAGDVIIGTQESVLLSIAQLQAFLSSQHGPVTLKVIRTKEPIAVSLLIQ
jgi:predicted metalloprotease with PDZ domain